MDRKELSDRLRVKMEETIKKTISEDGEEARKVIRAADEFTREMLMPATEGLIELFAQIKSHAGNVAAKNFLMTTMTSLCVSLLQEEAVETTKEIHKKTKEVIKMAKKVRTEEL